MALRRDRYSVQTPAEGGLFNRRRVSPAAAFLLSLTEKHTVADTEFLVGAGGYLTALARHDLSGHLDYHDRNHTGK